MFQETSYQKSRTASRISLAKEHFRLLHRTSQSHSLESVLPYCIWSFQNIKARVENTSSLCVLRVLKLTSKNTTQSYDLPLTKAICLGLTQCWVMMKPQLFIHDMISMACCTSIRWCFKSIHCFFPLPLTLILPFCVISWIFSNPIFARAQPAIQLPVLLVWLICGQSLVSHWCAPMMQSNRGSEWRSLWLGLNTLNEGGCRNHPVCWRTRSQPQFTQYTEERRIRGNECAFFI